MKSLIFLLLCAGCASERAVAIKPEAPPCPTVVHPPCTDELRLMEEETLRKGMVCPDNTRLTFPISGYFQPGKVLVLCQCK